MKLTSSGDQLVQAVPKRESACTWIPQLSRVTGVLAT